MKLMYKDLMVQNTDFFQNILYGVQYLRKWEERALVSPSEETQWLDATDRLKVSYVTAVNRCALFTKLVLENIYQAYCLWISSKLSALSSNE